MMTNTKNPEGPRLVVDNANPPTKVEPKPKPKEQVRGRLAPYQPSYRRRPGEEFLGTFSITTGPDGFGVIRRIDDEQEDA